MTDTNTEPTSKKPTHVAYHVRDREGGKPPFRESQKGGTLETSVFAR